MSTLLSKKKRATIAVVSRFQCFRHACRRIFGVPDYERYCQHIRDHHPRAVLLSPREFHVMATAKRYGASGSHCC
jgi:uncharacterized short protein YbdD (DUF466 family)